LWQDAARAAALEDIGSDVGPLILGNSVSMLKSDNGASARSRLVNTQAILAFAVINHLDLFKSAYGAATIIGLDASQIDDSLRDYIDTAAILRDAYYDRWTKPLAGDRPATLGAFGVVANYFATVEVSLRLKLTPDDRLALADAKVNQGLAQKQSGQPDRATDDYQAALALFEASRRDQTALAAADQAFAMNTEAASDLENAQGAAAPAQYVTTAASESYLPISIVADSVGGAQSALQAKQQDSAKSALDLIQRANTEGDWINQFLVTTWPCQPQLAKVHFWRAVLSGLRLNFAKTFTTEAAADQGKYLDDARREFVAALTISLHALGPTDDQFKTFLDQYEQFLKTNGQDGEAATVAQAAQKLSPSDIGIAAPDAWTPPFACATKAS